MQYFFSFLATISSVLIKTAAFTPPTISECFRLCGQEVNRGFVERGLKYNVSGWDNRTLDVFLGQYTREEVEYSCNIHEETASCVTKCPDSDAKTFALGEGKRGVAYYCEESIIRNNSQCWYDTAMATQNDCSTLNKCGVYKDKHLKMIEADLHPLRGPNKEEFLKNNCKYIKCYNNCRKPTVINRCGQEFQDQIDLFLIKVMNLSVSIYKRRGGLLTLEECDDTL